MIGALRVKYHFKTIRTSYGTFMFSASLRNLDTEAILFYNRALYDVALLSRCYIQHQLRTNLDSEINHIRHFIKTQFVNKGIEFVNLPSILKDKSAFYSIPTYNVRVF